MKYTQGKWKLTDDGYVTAGENYVYEPNNLGFQIKPGGIIPNEVLANARLISAAPDMYEALKRLAKEIRPQAYHGMLDEADMALAKAEGK